LSVWIDGAIGVVAVEVVRDGTGGLCASGHRLTASVGVEVVVKVPVAGCLAIDGGVHIVKESVTVVVETIADLLGERMCVGVCVVTIPVVLYKSLGRCACAPLDLGVAVAVFVGVGVEFDLPQSLVHFLVAVVVDPVARLQQVWMYIWILIVAVVTNQRVAFANRACGAGLARAVPISITVRIDHDLASFGAFEGWFATAGEEEH